MNVAVVLVAGGKGARLGAGLPKALVPLRGEPLLIHALRRALATPEVTHVVVVAPSSHLGEVRMAVYSEIDVHTPVQVVAGGPERADSVAAGLRALRAEDTCVLVHDAARALAPTELFSHIIGAVRRGAAAVVPGMPVVDTVKQVDEQGQVVATPARAQLRAIQTPQGFLREVLEHAHAAGGLDGQRNTGGAEARLASDGADNGPVVAATDDAALVEAAGGHVLVIDGDHRALKITTPEDLAAADCLLAAE